VDSGWRTAQTVRALGEQARALAEALKTADPESLGLTLTEASDVTRTSFIADTPPAFLETVFDMQPGDIRVIEGATAAYLVRLDSIAPPDPDDADLAAQADQLAEATAQSLGADILQAYSSAVVKRAGISINQAAVNAVHTQFP
jgi:peptidyl-prolyl cis-trans isomerase D